MRKVKNNLLDNYFLNLANKLSEINLYETFPNPSVGAVALSKKNFSIGFTGKKGSPHAEYSILKKSKKNYFHKMFTSLEPCSHIGKNPSCVNLIVKKNIKKIITSSKDEDPRVKCQSYKKLKKNNIQIKYLKKITNSSFFHNSSSLSQKPYVICKLALSRDGYTKHKQKRLFTSKCALKFAHLLRYQSDCVLVGKNTINDDNPKLNIRINGLEKKIAKFVINKDLIFNKTFFKNKFLKNIYIFHSCSDKNKINKLKKNSNLVYFNFASNNIAQRILKKIYNLGYRKLLIEGGLKTVNFFIKENVINEFFIIKNNKNFTSKGLNSSKSFFNFKKSNIFQKLYLEDDTVFNYKLNNVYRYNSRNC